MVDSNALPELASTFVSLLIVMVTLPECTRKCFAVSSTATSNNVIRRNMPTPERTVSEATDNSMLDCSNMSASDFYAEETHECDAHKRGEDECYADAAQRTGYIGICGEAFADSCDGNNGE